MRKLDDHDRSILMRALNEFRDANNKVISEMQSTKGETKKIDSSKQTAINSLKNENERVEEIKMILVKELF